MVQGLGTVMRGKRLHGWGLRAQGLEKAVLAHQAPIVELEDQQEAPKDPHHFTAPLRRCSGGTVPCRMAAVTLQKSRPLEVDIRAARESWHTAPSLKVEEVGGRRGGMWLRVMV